MLLFIFMLLKNNVLPFSDWKTKSVKSEKHQKLKNNLLSLIERKISNNIFVLFVYITLFTNNRNLSWRIWVFELNRLLGWVFCKFRLKIFCHVAANFFKSRFEIQNLDFKRDKKRGQACYGSLNFDITLVLKDDFDLKNKVFWEINTFEPYLMKKDDQSYTKDFATDLSSIWRRIFSTQLRWRH